MIGLVSSLQEEGAMQIQLPLKPEGKKRISCHPVEEMDIDHLIRMMELSKKGLVVTESEDEAYDAISALQKRVDNNYIFEVSTIFGGFYLLGYKKRDI